MIRYYNYYQHIHQCQLLIGVYTTEYTALSGFIPMKFHITTMLAENSLNNHFFPLAKNIFTGSFSPAPYESYTKEKKKKNTHKDKGENGYGI
jgi:hypothetical protein